MVLVLKMGSGWTWTPWWRLIIDVGQDWQGVCRCSSKRLETRGPKNNRGLQYRSGTGDLGWVRTLQEIRCHGIWAGGEVQATKGTAEKGTFLIGLKALLNRARYVPLARTALDWADTADIPSTTARPAGV